MKVFKINIFLFLFYTTCFSQNRKISEINIFSLCKNELFINKFETRFDFFYFSTKNQILKLNKDGEILDSSIINCGINNVQCYPINFDVIKSSKKEETIVYGNIGTNSINKLLNNNLTSVSLNQILNDTLLFGKHQLLDFTVDEKQNLYILHKPEFNIKNKNFPIYLTSISDAIVHTKKLPSNFFFKNFKIQDTIFAFGTIRLDGNYVFLTNTKDFSYIDSFNLNKFLMLPLNERLLTRILFLNNSFCLTVASSYKSAKDYIMKIDLVNLKIEKILELNLKKLNTNQNSSKNIIKGKENDYFIFENYPNGKQYSYENGKLFVFYGFNSKKKYIETYDLNSNYLN